MSWWCLKPSASSVRRSAGGWPIAERICRTRTSPLPAGCLPGSRQRTLMRRLRVGGFLATGHRLLARLVRDRVDLNAPLLGHASRRGQVLQAVERRPDHIMRVSGPQAFGEDVTHARALEDGAHRPTGDHARPGRRRLEEDASRAVMPDDLVGDGAAGERHLRQAAARGLHGLAHRLAHLVGLAGGDADAPLAVAHGDERVEAEPPAALHDLRDAVDRDDVLEDAVALAGGAVVATLPAAAAAATTTTPAPAALAAPAPACTTTATPTHFGRPLLGCRRGARRCGGG